MRHRAKFRGDRCNRCGDMTVYIFPIWQPSAILELLCGDCTTDEGRLMVFITMQNLVGIGALVSIKGLRKV